MAWLRPFVAVLTVYCMIPGAGELVENLVHVVVSGHTAHALDDDEHEPRGAEHGCSGTAHLCSCCQSPAFVTPGLSRPAAARFGAHGTLRLPPDDSVAEGFVAGVFRPPILQAT